MRGDHHRTAGRIENAQFASPITFHNPGQGVDDPSGIGITGRVAHHANLMSTDVEGVLDLNEFNPGLTQAWVH